jgi:hypothetical protein
MRNEYDQTEPDYGTQQQFDTPPINAKLENAPLLDLQAGAVTMARLLALVKRKHATAQLWPAKRTGQRLWGNGVACDGNFVLALRSA